MASTTVYLSLRRRRTQKGAIGLIELGVALVIGLIISILAVPSINEYIVEYKTQRVGEELQRFISRALAGGQASSDPMTAYAGAEQIGLARAVGSSGVLSVNPTNNTVEHGIGSAGTVEYGPADGGQGLQLTLDRVNAGACPALATILSRMVNKISINGTEQMNTETPLHYNAANAEVACQPGDDNVFIFTAGNYERN